MCGIVGCAGNLNHASNKAFRDMLLFDVPRGQDSTGVVKIGLNKDAKVETAKDIGHPINLWDELADNPEMFDARGVIKGFARVLIGHNRAATQGEVNVDNAHPFTYDHITGVHNGTLWNTDKLEGNFDVDSKSIYYTIAKKGIHHTWENLMGAAALVWWDDKEKELCMIRNKERPLYFLYDEPKKALYWASEPWMITVAMMRSGVKPAKDKEGKPADPVLLGEDTLYRFNPTSVDVKYLGYEKLKKYSPNRGGAGFHKPHGHVANCAPTKKGVINTGWTQGLPKADRSLKGLRCRLRYAVSMHSQTAGRWVWYAIAETIKDGTRVEIFPNSIEQFKMFEKIAERDKELNEFIITCRPREGEFYNIKSYMVDGSYVKFDNPLEEGNVVPFQQKQEQPKEEEKRYAGFNGVRYSEKEIKDKIAFAGGTCIACDKSIDVENVNEVYWMKEYSMLCDECCGDPMTQRLVEHM